MDGPLTLLLNNEETGTQLKAGRKTKMDISIHPRMKQENRDKIYEREIKRF